MDTGGKNESRIAEYIKNQLEEEQLGEQLTMSELGPFLRGQVIVLAQAGRPYYTFDVPARIIGLCPHMKNPRRSRRFFIYYAIVPF